MTIRPVGNRKGIMLVELLSVLAVAAVVSALAWNMANRIIVINAGSTRVVNCLLTQDHLVERIREDIAGVAAFPEAVNQDRSDKHLLLIDQQGAVVRYRYRDFAVTREVVSDNDKAAGPAPQRWALPKTNVAFRVANLLHNRDALTIDVTTDVLVRHARTITRKTTYELLLP